MSDRETDRVERKQSASDTRKISEAICGMSNDLANHRAPGFIMIGLQDDGSCAGLPLRAADGAIGAHQAAVKSAFDDFQERSVSIAKSIDLPVPGWFVE